MSDPAPSPENTHPPSPTPVIPGAQRKRKAGSRQSFWMTLSIILHVVAILALIFLTPVRQILFQPAEEPKRTPDLMMAANKVSQVAETLEEINREHIEQNLRAMHELIEQMNELRDEQLDDFSTFEQAQLERTPQHLTDRIQQAIEAMDRAAEAIAANDYTKAGVEQELVTSVQTGITQRLEMIQASQAVSEAQQKTIEAQAKAAEKLEESREASRQATSAQRQLEKDVAQQEKLAQAVERDKQELTDAQQKREEKKQALDQANSAIEQINNSEDKKQIAEAKKKAQQAEREFSKEQSQVERREKELAQTEEKAQAQQTKVAEQTQVVERVNQQKNQAREAAHQQQLDAKKAQADTAKAIEQEAVKRAQELLAQMSQAQDPALLPESRALLTAPEPMPDTRQMDALTLYEATLAAEKQLTEQYRQVRAMELAMLQDVPLAAAMEAVDPVKPIRPDLRSSALTADARTTRELDEKKRAMETALSETGSMVSLGNQLLQQAMREAAEGQGQGGGSISLEAIQAKSAQMQQLEALASQDQSGRAVDLSAMMRGGAGGSEDGFRSSGQTLPSAAPPPVTGEGGGAKASGRVVGTGGKPTQWMMIADWFILGPFPNPARANIDRRFPPESLVDLNATYIGKGGRTIRWEFVHSEHDRGMVTPPHIEDYGIWYAYTELRMDRDRDLWITMGSDDKGAIWINDTPVWISPSEHKPWRPNEAQRKVHFKQGRNRILYRVENGQHTLGFSLWVHLDEQ